MLVHDLPVRSLSPSEIARVSGSCILLYILFSLATAFYNAFLGPLRKYPGPPLRALSKLPLLWSTARGNEDRERVQLHQKYGPVVRVAPNQLSYAGGAQAWKDIYGHRKHGQASNNKFLQFYAKPFNEIDSLITADDPSHSRQRRIVSHSFADRTLKDLEPLLMRWITKMRGKLEEKSQTTEQIDLLKYYNCTTFDIMGDLTFSASLGMLDNGEYSSWVKAIFEGIKGGTILRTIRDVNSVTNWIFAKFVMSSPKFAKKRVEHWNYSAERVARRLETTPDTPDLWAKILEKGSGPNGLSYGEHESNASLFMIAGTETTATLLSGTTYYLLRNPQYLEKLTREIRDAFGSFEEINMESVQRLKYLHAVLQEGLRVYPPVPTLLPRVAPKNGAIICDEFVPGGTVIGVHQLATYRSEANFKDSLEFRPERWLGDPAYRNDRLDSVEAFSVGPRNCLGKNLAWHEMRLILVTVLHAFDLKLCAESEQWRDQRSYTIWEKKPLMVQLSPAKREN
ncbi:hypothetical protein CERZMDRAFT_37216 [Cercospora zeae-maydis SCOH1-5]|uniref:Cytochrome P450 monooxygenase n=1 Tax=Cercospora zeae-maydis SCOH1-5 TaxID=717836 RepID=A0A6A6FNN1_9PEZI|nr:hypothetical protein CERZMDRAFT_37216 [Cercospora zeae-maydis SCOH1-5]